MKSYKNQWAETMQLQMFDPVTSSGVSIESSAQQTNVSPATIRNWIKTGYLHQEANGQIRVASIENFLTETAGQEKLTGRANKSHKDSHDHTSLMSSFLEKLINKDIDIDGLSTQYEISLSESFKNKEGIYYTPPNIVSDLLKNIDRSSIASKKFLDPCCGSGNFVMRAIELGFRPQNVFGYDTDPIAVEITKRKIFEKTGYVSSNIKNADFLEEALKPHKNYFDYIYTNPPWGKKLSKEEKEKYGFLFQAGRSIDTCSLFFFASLQNLNEGGELGLLLPDSFFNIAAFESARIKALSHNIIRLIDYEKPFKGLMTKAFAFVLKNKSFDINSESITCELRNTIHYRSTESFLKNPKSIINFQSNSASEKIIRHVFATPHITLVGRAKWGLGIVTGSNDKFLKSKPFDNCIPVFRGSDIQKGRLSDPSCYIPSDLSLYQQVAPLSFYNANVKLIYKFISSKLCFYCDTEQRYVLNSANILIPNEDFSISASQLCDLLNSDFLNWLFSELFRTHKILRGDLEVLPIHCEYFRKHSIFYEQDFLNFLSIERTSDGAYRIKNQNH